MTGAVSQERVRQVLFDSRVLVGRQVDLAAELQARRAGLAQARERMRGSRGSLGSTRARLGHGVICPGSPLASPGRIPAVLAGGKGGGGAVPHRLRRPRRSLQELAELYHRTRAPRLRAEVVTECLSWSTSLARGVARGSGADPEDLAQVASLAVDRALDRYDPARGDFEPFARTTVAGEVRHHLRSTEWAVRVPRRWQEAHRVVAQAREDLGARDGSAPTVAELAERTGLGHGDVAAVTGLRRRAASLEGRVGDGDGGTWLEEVDDGLESVPERVDLITALGRLDRSQRDLLNLYFFGELSQRRLAQRLGTSQIQVSRHINQALGRLRGRMAG